MNIAKKIKINYFFFFFVFICLFSGLQQELLIILLVLTIHELGHLFMIFITKTNFKKIYVTPIGCFIDINQNNNFIKSLLVYSGGLIFSICLLFILINLTNEFIFKINFFVILINFLPIVPLDGYNISYTLLSQIWEDEYLNELFLYLGLFILFLLFILFFFTSYFILLYLTIFLILKLLKNYKLKKQYIKLKNYTLFYEANYE